MKSESVVAVTEEPVKLLANGDEPLLITVKGVPAAYGLLPTTRQPVTGVGADPTISVIVCGLFEGTTVAFSSPWTTFMLPDKVVTRAGLT